MCLIKLLLIAFCVFIIPMPFGILFAVLLMGSIMLNDL